MCRDTLRLGPEFRFLEYGVMLWQSNSTHNCIFVMVEIIVYLLLFILPVLSTILVQICIHCSENWPEINEDFAVGNWIVLSTHYSASSVSILQGFTCDISSHIPLYDRKDKRCLCKMDKLEPGTQEGTTQESEHHVVCWYDDVFLEIIVLILKQQ